MTPALVIFDCDGVLVDTETVGNTVLANNLGRYGLEISPEEAVNLFAGGTMASAGAEALKRGALLPDNWLEEIYEEIFARLREGVDVVDGVIDLLDCLDQQGIAKAVASNGPIAKMEISLRPSGLWSRFDGNIYSGHDHGPKPAPDMVLKIIDDAGVAKDQTILIDDMWSGCRAAQAAGIRCFGYVAEGNPGRIDGTGAIPMSSMAAIIDALGLR